MRRSARMRSRSRTTFRLAAVISTAVRSLHSSIKCWEDRDGPHLQRRRRRWPHPGAAGLWAITWIPKFRDHAPASDARQRRAGAAGIGQKHWAANAAWRRSARSARDGTVVVGRCLEYKDGRRAGSTRMRASPTWISTGSTPPSCIRHRLVRRRGGDPDISAAICRPTTAGSPITASPTPTGCSASRMLPLQSCRPAIAEMKFARKELGMTGSFVRPNPTTTR